LVTGAGRGQGRAHARVLAEHGADVAIADLPVGAFSSMPYGLSSPADLETTAAQVEAAGVRSLVVPADVRRPEQVESMVEHVVGEFGRIDVLVANAGICAALPIEEITNEQWNDMVETNLAGVFYCVRAVAPLMRAQNTGRIVIVSSMAGRRGMANLTHYCATKFGVIGVAKAAALELMGSGVTVHVLCPTTVDTPMIHYPENYAVF
jgi:NAD(P)-dependent dehydrogenase (short-subunit alcohol dehydrogenase family)